MTNEPYYLRPNVQVEPLVDQWYAWPHLIPPATAARNITERHLKIMTSYIDAPRLHANAARNPKLLGGPFIDYDGQRVDEIAALRNRTNTLRAPLIELSSALDALDELLRTEAKGHSLEGLYPRVPDLLRGYVELTYDLRHQASYRLLEPLLYRSRFYDASMQTMMLSTVTGDDRPFLLSTPRLDSPDALHLPWTFADERLDVLFALKKAPRPWSWILDHLGVDGKQAEALRGFFTTEPPAPYVPYDGNGVRWRYFGHACILIETRSISILFDPVLSYTYESEISRYTYADLPDRIDYVVITHNHQDHILFETLLQLRHKIGQIVVPRNGSGVLQDPSLKLMLQQIGFPRVLELGELETVAFDGGSITGLPFFGEHADLAVSTKLAYVVRLGREQLLFAADSCNIEPRLYEHIRREIGDVSAMFLGMECDGAPLTWLYGALLSRPIDRAMDQSRRLNGSTYEQAIAIVNQFNGREVYVYAMGQEPWLNYVMRIKYTEESRPIVESNALLRECAARGIIGERLFGEKEILIDGLYESAAGAAGVEAPKARTRSVANA